MLSENLFGAIERLDRHQIDLTRQWKLAEERNGRQGCCRRTTEPSWVLLAALGPYRVGRHVLEDAARQMPHAPRGFIYLDAFLAGYRRLGPRAGCRLGHSRRRRLRRFQSKAGELRGLPGSRSGNRLRVHCWCLVSPRQVQLYLWNGDLGARELDRAPARLEVAA